MILAHVALVKNIKNVAIQNIVKNWNKHMKQWDEIFKEYGKYFKKYHKALPYVVKSFKKHRIKRILALGCGSGRNVVYFAKKDFLVYGIDTSREGIKIAKKWLKEESLRANLRVGSIFKKLPYKTNFFDAALCISALQHSRREEIKKAIKEIKRVLRPKGLFFLTVPRKKPDFKTKKIEPRTYLILGGEEKGAIHYIYTKRLLKKDFQSLNIYKIWVDYWGYWALLGRLKN